MLRIRALYPSLSDTGKAVAEYVLNNPEPTLGQSIEQLAGEVRVSPASVVRFCQALGYSGFPQFKAALRVHLLAPDRRIYEAIEHGDAPDEVVRKVLAMAHQSIEDTAASLDIQQLEQAVEALLQAPRIELLARGFSSVSMAELAAHRLLNLGLSVSWQRQTMWQRQAAGLLRAGDVVLAISHSGENEEMLQDVRIAARRGAKTIFLGNYPESSVARACDIALITATWVQAPLRGEAVSSRIAQMSLLDCLYTLCVLAQSGDGEVT